MGTSIDEWAEGARESLARALLVKKHYPEAELGTLPDGRRVFMANLGIDAPLKAELVAEKRAKDSDLSPLVYVVPYVTLKSVSRSRVLVEAYVFSVNGPVLVNNLPEEISLALGNWARGGRWGVR